VAGTQSAFHQQRKRFFGAQAYGIKIRCSPQQVVPHERPLCHARQKTLVELLTLRHRMSAYVLSGRHVLVPDFARCVNVALLVGINFVFGSKQLVMEFREFVAEKMRSMGSFLNSSLRIRMILFFCYIQASGSSQRRYT
jgi:hypothetical protein